MPGRRPRIGDIIEIPVEGGLAYAQYTHFHAISPRYGSFVHVIPGIFSSRPKNFRELIAMEPLFSTFVPIGTAINQGVFTIVAHEAIPEERRAFPLFRAGILDPDTGKVGRWWLWDGEHEWEVGQLLPEHRGLPFREIINDTLLIERISSGWRPGEEI